MSSPLSPPDADFDSVEAEDSANVRGLIYRVGIPVALAVLTWFLCGGLKQEQRIIATIFSLTVGLWIAEPIPVAVTALLSTSLLVLAADVGEKAAFAAYGDPLIILFIGSFLLAKAMEVTKLSERTAWWLLRQKWAAANGGRLLFATGAITCVISLFVSNTGTTAMLLPIAACIITAMGADKTRFATAMMLMLTWGSSVAVGVPVGTPPNLIGMGLIEKATGTHITFVQWMAFGMPITVIMVFFAWLILRVMDVKKDVDTSDAMAEADARYKAMPPMKPSEKVLIIAFSTALFLWVMPDLLAAVFDIAGSGVPKSVKWMQTHITATVASLVGASVLFLLPASDRPSRRALTWKEGTTINWGVMLLFGGGIALGQAMFSSGLAEVLGKQAAEASGANSVWAITALATGASILLSELASNTAAATTLVPVAIGLAQGAGVSPIPPALGAAIGASFGFMLPVSTAPNAIVYSSGQVSVKQMAIRGAILDVLAFFAIMLCLWLILPVLHLAG